MLMRASCCNNLCQKLIVYFFPLGLRCELLVLVCLLCFEHFLFLNEIITLFFIYVMTVKNMLG